MINVTKKNHGVWFGLKIWKEKLTYGMEKRQVKPFFFFFFGLESRITLGTCDVNVFPIHCSLIHVDY